MDALKILLASTGGALALAVLALMILARPYGRILTRLCGDEGHGRFWRAFSWVGVVLVTLFGAVLAVSPSDPSLWGEEPRLGVALASFRAGLLGLILALALVALVLLVSIGQRRADAHANGTSA